MKKEEALNIIKQVCLVYRGTLQEHTGIQEALRIIEQGLNPPETKEKKDE